jgi:glycosyltransferase involved in cell wall biosynthesis
VETLVFSRAFETRATDPQNEFEIGRVEFQIPKFFGSNQLKSQIRSLVKKKIAGRRYDAVVIRYLPEARMLRPLFDIPLILDADDLVKRRSAQQANFKSKVRITARNAIAKRLIRAFKYVWYANHQDAADYPSAYNVIIPNAIDVPTLSKPQEKSKKTILMVGTYAYEPNREGASYFANRILPTIRQRMPEVEFYLAGKCPDDFRKSIRGQDGVVALGFVDDLSQAYADADLVVAPIHSGGGSQIKVLEAMAYARPLVGSELALNGFKPHLTPGKHALQAEGDNQWVESCVALLQDPRRSEELGKGGRSLVEAEFSYEQMQKRVCKSLADWFGG